MDVTVASAPRGADLESRVQRAIGSSAELNRVIRARRARRDRVRASVHAARLQRTGELATARSAAVSRRRAQVGLTPRQHEILVLMSEGRSTKQIAAELWLSPATVRNHVAATMTALGTHSRLEAVAVARRAGLLGPTGRPAG